MKRAFRHIREYYSPQNISIIKYLFIKNAQKTTMTTFRRTSCSPAVEKRPRLSARNWCPRHTMRSQHSKQMQITLTAVATICICKRSRWVFTINF